MDKDYSRVAARMAISQLFDEINVRREPVQAEQRFRAVAVVRDDASRLLRMSQAFTEGSLAQRFEQILRLVMTDDGGRVS